MSNRKYDDEIGAAIGDDLGCKLGKLLWARSNPRILGIECTDIANAGYRYFVYLKLNDNKLWW